MLLNNVMLTTNTDRYNNASYLLMLIAKTVEPQWNWRKWRPLEQVTLSCPSLLVPVYFCVFEDSLFFV